MGLRNIEPIDRYVAAVSIAGIATGIAIVAGRAPREIRAATPAVWGLMVLVVIGELYPIKVPLRDE